MRKLIISMAFLCLAFMANAQTEKGNFYLGGGGSLTYHTRTTTLKYNDSEMMEFVDNKYLVNPSIGYFVINGLAVGIDVMYLTNTTDYSYPGTTEDNNGSEDKITSGETMIGVFAKYYYGDKKLKPFVNGKIGYVNLSEEISYVGDEYENYKTDARGLGFAGSIGAIYFLNDHVGLELGAGYGFAATTDKDDDNLTIDGSSIAISVAVYVTF